MDGFSVWHWGIVLTWAIVLIVPFWKIFRRTGIPPALSLLAPIPFMVVLFLWVLAFKRWPER